MRVLPERRPRTGRRRPDADLLEKREQITINTPPVSELMLAPTELAREARPAGARKMIVIGVVLAVALELVAWFVADALR